MSEQCHNNCPFLKGFIIFEAFSPDFFETSGVYSLYAMSCVGIFECINIKLT